MYRRATCDTVPTWEQKSPATEAMSVFTAGMPAKLTRVQLRRHAGGKDCDVFCCRRCCVLICRRSIAGSTGGYVAGTSAAYENQALVERNSKQSVSFLTCISAFSLRTFEHWTHHKLVYSRIPNSSCVGYSQLIFGPTSSWICLNLTLLTQLCIYLSFETCNVCGIKIQFNILGGRVFDFVSQQFSTIYEYLNGWRHVKAVEACSKMAESEDLFGSTPIERPLIQELCK